MIFSIIAVSDAGTRYHVSSAIVAIRASVADLVLRRGNLEQNVHVVHEHRITGLILTIGLSNDIAQVIGHRILCDIKNVLL
jgi:hypothetical protein